MTDRLLAYTDKLTLAPGESTAVKVSAPHSGHYTVKLIRLICGDDHVRGPGYKATDIPCEADGEYPARYQPIHAGSYIRVDNGAAFNLQAFTLQAFIWPTWIDKGAPQSILGNFDRASQSGYALYLDENGKPAFRIGSSPPVVLDEPLLARHWYRIGASFDGDKVSLAALTLKPYPGQPMLQAASGSAGPSASAHPFLIAAWHDGDRASAHFNGKIDAPRVLDRALSGDTLTSMPAPGDAAFASWDFSQGMSGIEIRDSSRNALHGRSVNLPTRAMTGWNWDGSEHNWRHRPEQYGAIHFHDDDLYDCAWQTDFTFTVPNDLKSGIYCLQFNQGELEEFTPLFVRPPRGSATAPLALLIPTASYLAYANHLMPTGWEFEELSSMRFETLTQTDLYLDENKLGLSTYDEHEDGSGVCHSSWLRPILNMRPKGELWQFPADTHITDWLEAKGITCDIITDDDLEIEGAALLSRYRCVLTGTHPEYYSEAMLDGVEDYLNTGGRLMYLGANGFYWRIAWHPTLPGVIEHRRAEDGMRAWFTESGENYLAFTGEYSGLWRRNGRPPNALVGAGFSAQGFDLSSSYRRLPVSFDRRAAFIFEGIGDDEIIGNFGLLGGGAAGWEIDRADVRIGTPPHALIVATADDFPASYHWVKEEFNHSHSAINGDTCPMVRCDMVFFETPKGGAVFSTSSISWAGALSHDNYRNNVSRITENVLRRFLDPMPFDI